VVRFRFAVEVAPLPRARAGPARRANLKRRRAGTPAGGLATQHHLKQKMTAPPPPLNFISTLKDRRSAEYLLAERAFGTYVTWCLGKTELGQATTYFITYVSNIERAPVHVQFSREPGEGSFRLTDGLDADERFLCLEDFIASRSYLDPAAPAPGARGGGGEGAALSPAALAAAPALRRRGGGGGGGWGDVSAQDAPGAPAARLPASLAAAPPPPGVIPDDDEAAEVWDKAGVAIDENRYFRGVRPVCGEARLRGALERVAWAGAAAGALVACARLAAHHGARTALVRASEAAAGAVDAATGELYRALREGGGDAARCEAAVGAWRAVIAGAGAAAGGALRGERWALPYAWLLLGVALLAGAGSLALFLVHTGRPGFSLNTADTTAGGRRAREPLCRPNQGRWARAFFSLVGTTLLAAASFVSLANGAAGAPSAASRAAATLSLRWPAGRNAHFGSGGEPPPAGAAPEEAAAWRLGTWGGAMTYAHAPRECLVAVAAAVEPWVDGPPALPLPLPLPAGGGGGGGGRLAWGWLHVGPPPAGGLQLLMPTRAGITHGALVLTSIYTFSVVILLMGVEAYATQVRPMILRWRARRGRGKAQGAKD